MWRVLIVDDERLFGEALRDFLSDTYEVELTTTVATTLARLRDGAPFDVILCDVQLPDGTAMQIYEALRAADAMRGFVFVSGGTDDPDVRALVASGRHPVLVKPFDLDTLPALIERQASLARLG
jgi:DNA-binding NtrC family response regulator